MQVSEEMSLRLEKMENMYKDRVHQEISLVEQKYERKIAIIERVKNAKGNYNTIKVILHKLDFILSYFLLFFSF